MNTITDYFQQAELALAAYSTLTSGLPPDIGALQDNGKGMSATQAAAFASTYTVVDQYTDPVSGFSATVFQDAAGKRYFSIRGTEDGSLLDYVADADLALSGAAATQTIALFNYIQRLEGVKGQPVAQLAWNGQDYTLNPTGAVGLLDTPLSGALAVTGHSLGGHLAMALGRLFPQATSQIYTYNAPGFIDTAADSFFARVDAALGRSSSTFADAKTTNLYGSGLNIIAGYANDHGTPQAIFLESNAHSIVPLTDSLAVYNLLATLDPSLTLDAATGILKASSNVAAYSLESAVTALGKLFNVPSAVVTGSAFDADRNKLYIALNDINSTVQGGYGIVALDNMNAATLARNAKTNIAYRYALVNSLPFAVVGADYSTLNVSGDYDLFNTTTGQGSLTEQYLTDRAAYLVAKLRDNTVDSLSSTLQDIRYSDLATNTTLNPINTELRRVTFGGAADEGFSGGSGLFWYQVLHHHCNVIAQDLTPLMRWRFRVETINGEAANDETVNSWRMAA